MSAELTPEQVADALDDAADYIEAHGWCQGSWQRKTGEVCSDGAIKAVMKRPLDPQWINEWKGAQLALAGFLVEHEVVWWDLPLGGGVLLTFNDRAGRTKQEVLDAFRLAAKQQRGRSPA